MRALILGLGYLMLASNPVAAQDYLGIHSDTIRDNNLRNHQIEGQRMQARKGNRPTTTATRARRPNLAERQAAWSRNKTEYRKRMLRDGKASADRWLDQQAQTPSNSRRVIPADRTGASCKRVRYVTRAAPGFGGEPMKLRRIAICAD